MRDGGLGATGDTLRDGKIHGVYDSNGIAQTITLTDPDTPGIDTRGARAFFTPATAGTYYISAGVEDPGGYLKGNDRYTLTLRTDEYSADTTTTGTVEVGGLVRGQIYQKHASNVDVDWIKVTLEAGVHYQFTVTLRSGAFARIVGIYDSEGSVVQAGTEHRTWATVLYKPAAAGDYYVAVGDRSTYGSEFELYVWSDTQGATSEPESGDLGHEDVYTRGHIPPNGVPAEARIHRNGDVDWFTVWLDKGTTYRILIAGQAVLTHEDLTRLKGVAILGVMRRPIWPAMGRYPDIGRPALGGPDQDCVEGYYTAQETGIHYVAATARHGNTGPYQMLAFERRPAASVSEPGGTDFADDTSTAGHIRPNEHATGNIDSATDVDWFYMELLSDQRVYRISLEGADTSNGTLTDPMIIGIYDAAGNAIPYSNVVGEYTTGDYDAGVGRNALVMHTPYSKGNYYVAVAGQSETTGTYTLDIDDVTDTSLSEPSGVDFTNWFLGRSSPGSDVRPLNGGDRDSTLAGYLVPGVPATGTLDSNESDDSDSYTLRTTPNRRYRVEVKGAQSGQGDLFKPDVGLTYGEIGSQYHPLIGTQRGLGDYILDLYRNDQSEHLPEPTLEFIAFPAEPQNPAAIIPVTWNAWIIDGGDEGDVPSAGATYTIVLTDITDSEDVSELGGQQTTGTVAVGGSVTGTLDAAGDADWFKVEFEQGKTYRIKLRGSESGGGTLADPHLRIIDSGGDAARAANDDKSDTEKDSELEFTALFTDSYFIEAATPSAGAGTYTIEVEEVTP